MMAAHHHANFSSAGPLASKEYDRHEDGQRSDTAGAADDQAALASIITQITEAPSQSSPAPAHPASSSWAIDQTAQPAADNATWKDRFRSLLCCFAPEPAAYGGSMGDPSGLRSGSSMSGMATAQLPAPLASPFALPAPLPPTPPRIWREAVIGPQLLEGRHKKTLVLDLDETLVHSSFKPIPNPDYILPVDIDGKLVDVYVLKRPWLDHFMSTIGPRFEVVVFTASLAKYADPLLDLLDKQRVVRWRLFRESCVPYEGNYVKDLNCLGRELCDVVIVDNSPHSYVFQPDNALPIGTFIDNMEDQELLEIMPVLLKVENVDDVRRVLPGSV